jgi:Protein of unknown function (DUF2971)
MNPAPSIQQPGPWVGHYTTSAVAFEHIIPSGKLRMSPYRAMRDPIENKFLVPMTGWVGDPSPHPEADWAAAAKLAEQVRERVRLLSLTRDVVQYEAEAPRFGCCWARPRTWEQYAEAHRGVCLVFERAALEHALLTDLGEKVAFGEVDYTVGGIALTEADALIDPRIFDADAREQAVLDYIEDHRRELLFLKTDDWRSEHEFRAVLFDVSEDYAFADYGEALRAIVIGESFPDAQVAGAQALADQHGTELRKAHWFQGRPWLVQPT